ncbi:hypothetical protein GWK91_12580 [Virgibacillus sp. MSP4-1]|uniref:hypothetical protein n=1 Tax=Virgibacillus sp. MSP4-1 TaxID=2700081 RepID=UPI00039B9F75|nr:hypothetical protein [Virgibacillus sp. MSP4-1]QHS23735.1 hypothetical protein GWK91_12580 [Virgibacillus sp. MSP4-1]
MSRELCKLLEETPSGTKIEELMMNGEDVSRVDEFLKYDKRRGLVYFTNKENSTFVAPCEKIDMIEFKQE